MKNRSYLITAVLIISIVAMRCTNTELIPDELIGIWKTQAFRYRDTFFELRKDQIFFGTAAGDVFNYAITKVKREKKRRDGWILYTVYYISTDLQIIEFLFYYHSSKNGIVCFKNQQNVVWCREKT